MDLCNNHGIIEELRYDNAMEESIPETMMQIILRKFYIMGMSNETYNQHQNKCEGQIWYLQYRSKKLKSKANTPVCYGTYA